MNEDFEKRRVALVLGATGGIGGHVARGLLGHGWTVRALNRNAAAAALSEPRFQWTQGDSMSPEDVANAAEGAELIVHAVNPPGYRNWDKLVLPMLDNTIAAARRNGALILLPGTVYNYGPDTFPTLSEDSPQHPATRKGAIRVELESRLEAAAAKGDVSVLIVRAGDYFGPRAGGSWFNQALVTPGKPVTSVRLPNGKGTGHQWAYLPDVAETMLRLVDRRAELPRFARFHFDGFRDEDGMRMVEAIGRVIGRRPKVKAFGWGMLRLAAPFVQVAREIVEMRYLWSRPIFLRNDRLVAFLGDEPRTPIDEAVRATLADIGCI